MIQTDEALRLLEEDPSGRKTFNYCATISDNEVVYLLDEKNFKETIASLHAIFILLANCPNADDEMTPAKKLQIFNALDSPDVDSSFGEREDETIFASLTGEFAKVYTKHGRGLTFPFMFFMSKDNEGTLAPHTINIKNNEYLNLHDDSSSILDNIDIHIESAIPLCIRKYKAAPDNQKPRYEQLLKKLVNICLKRQQNATKHEQGIYETCVENLNRALSEQSQDASVTSVQHPLILSAHHSEENRIRPGGPPQG